MDQNQKPISVLETLGEELIRIITPVSICMLLVVILVTVLNTDSDGSSLTTIATIAYSESSSDSIWDKLKEWTTWVLLIAMALYDLAAVLLPGGPLRLLVELAIDRDEDIPALVYEARPVINNDTLPSGDVVQRRVWRERRNTGSALDEDSDVRPNFNPNTSPVTNSNTILGTYLSVGSGENEINSVNGEEGQVFSGDAELAAPLIQHRINVRMNSVEDASPSENFALQEIGLGSSGAIKLGLGDFIFYSVLVGRAAMYDFMTVYACYLAIIAGLGVTLILLAVYRKALPALPVSIMLGVLFYLLTRLLLEVFVVQCSLNLLMF
ncbi:unnamed protein product [Fraxinus pennsylvanica]|uniref:Presenilin n=1 Tax=Fraxinus pennsylvanica TaxID=56036 RepID=A0AAD1YMF6_9LAMI|nr:unnamed protein product [Fraxinus pennsylvanica]